MLLTKDCIFTKERNLVKINENIEINHEYFCKCYVNDLGFLTKARLTAINFKGDAYRLEFKNGETFEFIGDLDVLTRTGYKKLSSVKAGDILISTDILPRPYGATIFGLKDKELLSIKKFTYNDICFQYDGKELINNTFVMKTS